MITRIGKYEIQEELGRGGFGRVYRAYDPTVGRLVAIKVLNPTADKSVLNRFRNEATAAGNLHHKNIVTIHEFSESEGAGYLVMEFLQGRDLQKIMTMPEQPPLAQKLSIMTQVAEGLNCAHQSGVVHRDVKPANIMVLGDGTVKIMDFGIARLTRDQSTRLTQQGFVIGTVLYMSPEQLAGQEVDSLCDIWAYGTILYELLTGKHPFQAADARVVMYKITSEDPASLLTHNPHLPDALDAVIRRLLSRERELRYQNLEDVIFDIEPILIEARKSEAVGLFAQAYELYDQGHLDASQAVLRQVLELDPANRDARQLREKLGRGLRERTLRPRVEGLLVQADEQLKSRNFSEAIRLLDSASRLDPENSAVRAKLDESRARKEAAERAAQLVAEAHRSFQRDNLTTALQNAQDALRTDPENPEASLILDRIRRELDARENQRVAVEQVNRAKGLAMMGSFDEALSVLSDLAAHHPEKTEVIQTLSWVREQKGERDRQTRLSTDMATARALIKDGKLGPAIERLEGLRRDFPDVREPADLLAYAREEFQAKERHDTIDKMGREAWALSKAEKYEQALQMVERGLDQYPGDSVLTRLLSAIMAAKLKHDRETAIFKVLDACRKLREQKRFADALKAVEQARREHGDEPALVELTKEIEQDRDRYSRGEAIRKANEEGAQLINGGRYQQAVTLLEKATNDFPEDLQLVALLDKAQRLKKDTDDRQFLQDQLSRASQLENAENWSGALDSLRQAQRQMPSAKEIGARIELVEQKQRDAERKKKVGETGRAIRREIGLRNWSGARTMAETARREQPEEPFFETLLDEIQREERQDGIEASLGSARQLLAARDWSAARAAAEEGQRRYPDEPRFRLVLEEITREKQRREILDRASQALQNGKHEEADVLLQPLATRHPKDPEVRALISSIGERREEERRRLAYQDAREQVARVLKEGDHENAIEFLRTVLVQYPQDPHFEQELRKVTTARDEQRRLASEAAAREKSRQEGLRTARELLSKRRFDEAERKAQEVATQFGSDADIKTLMSSIVTERMQEDYRREKERAEKLLRERQWDQGIAALQALLSRFPNDTLEKELNAAIAARDREERARREAQENEERSRRLAAEEEARRNGVKRATDLLRRKQYDEAEAVARDLSVRFHDAADVQALLPMIVAEREREDCTAGRADADRMLREFQFVAAIDRLEALRRRYPTAGLERDIQAAQAALQAYEQKQRAAAEEQARQKSRQVSLEDGRSRLNSGQLDEAEVAAKRVLALFPGDLDAKQLLAAIGEERQKRERRAYYDRGLREAESRLAAGQDEAAADVLRTLLSNFPGDPAIEERLQQALAIARKRKIDARVAHLESLQRLRDAVGVQRDAIATLRDQEDPRVRALLAWAEQELAKDKLQGAGGVPVWIWPAAAVVLLGGGLAIWHPWTGGGGGDAKKTTTIADGRTTGGETKRTESDKKTKENKTEDKKTEEKKTTEKKTEDKRTAEKKTAEKKTDEKKTEEDPRIVAQREAEAKARREATCGAQLPEVTDYTGAPTGMLRWSGELPAGGKTTLCPGMPGNTLPGVKVEVKVQVPAGVVVEEQPSSGTRFRRLVFRNTSPNTVTEIQARWATR